MLVSAVYLLSWKKMLGSFESSTGTVLPQTVRNNLLKYFTEGEIPTGFLYGLLVRDISKVFCSEKTPLEAQRLQTIWEFLHDNVPSHFWGSQETLQKYSFKVKSGELLERQLDFLAKQKEIENNPFKDNALELK